MSHAISLSRRGLLGGVAASALSSALPRLAAATDGPLAFSRDMIVEKARALSRSDFTPRDTVPEDWRALSYDQYRDIRFPIEHALWADTDRSYNIDFFAPGLYFPRATKVSAVEDGTVRPVPFDLAMFDKGDLVPDLTKTAESLGFSGIRLRTDLGHPEYKTEFCVFQGASYFRAIGIGQTYGLSGRGLALRTADPEGEEFPEFIEFWLEAPGPDQANMVVHALMDSPSVTGAYRFDIAPGPASVMEVEATLFPRVELDHVGLGPLTSMFLFDQTNRNQFDDFRPAVHDNDGLLMLNGNGEVIWRPLANPSQLQVSSFVDTNPRGFGLMQRARKLSDFADLEALYHNRPGLWVEPKGDWGRGAVTLVEIPTREEIYDNIVAYWRPADPMPAGQQVDLSYRLTWAAEAPVQRDVPRVLNTAMGKRAFGEGRVVVIDFEDSPLFDDGPDEIDMHIHSPHVEVSDGVLQRNPATGGLRLAFNFDPGERGHVELRAQLRKDGQDASEVWLYRWTA
ncbi:MULTISPECIES: glucan biosynthesis protein [unclassified Roseovarius]|uniref:glucan biosynthesis protein n=1 Tax=unclassified Roseovarius TaxID=2614913 RepID=UPI00273D83EA|nr:glucan biosynthesis protein G [Roseovarius sp. MMSF_3350]